MQRASFRFYVWQDSLGDIFRAASWKRRETLSATVRAALEASGILDEGRAALDDWEAAGRPKDFRRAARG